MTTLDADTKVGFYLRPQNARPRKASEPKSHHRKNQSLPIIGVKDGKVNALRN